MDIHGTNDWMQLFLLLFFVMSALITISSWFGAKRKKRRLEKRYKVIEQEMIEREKMERANWTQADWNRNRGIKNIKTNKEK